MDSLPNLEKEIDDYIVFSKQFCKALSKKCSDLKNIKEDIKASSFKEYLSKLDDVFKENDSVDEAELEEYDL